MGLLCNLYPMELVSLKLKYECTDMFSLYKWKFELSFKEGMSPQFKQRFNDPQGSWDSF